MSTEEIIRQAQALSLDDRLKLVDSLLRSLNPPDPEIERQWVDVALSRLEDIRSGAVETIPGDVVLDKLRRRFARG